MGEQRPQTLFLTGALIELADQLIDLFLGDLGHRVFP